MIINVFGAYLSYKKSKNVTSSSVSMSHFPIHQSSILGQSCDSWSSDWRAWSCCFGDPKMLELSVLSTKKSWEIFFSTYSSSSSVAFRLFSNCSGLFFFLRRCSFPFRGDSTILLPSASWSILLNHSSFSLGLFNDLVKS